MTSLDNYRAMLRINRHRLDDELECHAQISEEIGREVARKNSYMLEKKKSLDTTLARLISKLKATDEKMSNPVAENEAKRDSQYDEAWKGWQATRAELEEWQAVKDAWYQKGFDLKALGDLYAHQYFALDAIRGPYPSKMESIRAQQREKVGDYSRPEEETPRRRRANVS